MALRSPRLLPRQSQNTARNHTPLPQRWFDRVGIRKLDRLALEEFGVPSIVLMENAGRAVADAVLAECRAGQANDVLILCGRGNNGGDGLVVARHLHNQGIKVVIALISPVEEMKGDARINAEIVRAMRLWTIAINHNSPRRSLQRVSGNPVIIDALLGTGLERPVGGALARVIGWTNERRAARGTPVIAVDVPSGLDCDTGTPLGIAVRASTTITLVGPKIGFKSPDAKQYLGVVRIADIGVPRELGERLAYRTGAKSTPARSLSRTLM